VESDEAYGVKGLHTLCVGMLGDLTQ